MKLKDFLIFNFLALDKDNWVVEILFLKMVFIIFSKNLNLATEIIVWALNELKLTDISMSFQVLSLNFMPALIVTFNDFAKAPLIMRLKILVDDYLWATHILALDSPEVACQFMRFHLPSFEFDYTAFLE